MKKILIIIILSLLSLTAFSQIPFKIHNPDVRFKWGADSIRFDITGKRFYLRDTIFFADGTKQWSADTVGGVAGNWSMSGLKIYPTTPNAYVHTDSSYWIKGSNILSYYNHNLIIGDSAGLGGVGAGSVKIGYAAGMLDNGSANVEIGPAAGGEMTGSENVIIGDQSGAYSITNASVMIGTNSGLNSNSDSSIYIGYEAGNGNTLDKWLFIGKNDSTKSPICGYIGSGTKRIRLNGNVNISGNLKYNYIHGVASTDSIAFTTGSTQNVYYKINPTGEDTLKDHEVVGVSFPGDSIKIATAGHYRVNCWLNLSTSGANDKVRVKIFKNNASLPLFSVGTWVINSDGTGTSNETKYFMWYLDLAVNDILSIRVANITGAMAVVVRDFKLFIEKTPE